MNRNDNIIRGTVREVVSSPTYSKEISLQTGWTQKVVTSYAPDTSIAFSVETSDGIVVSSALVSKFPTVALLKAGDVIEFSGAGVCYFFRYVQKVS